MFCVCKIGGKQKLHFEKALPNDQTIHESTTRRWSILSSQRRKLFVFPDTWDQTWSANQAWLCTNIIGAGWASPNELLGERNTQKCRAHPNPKRQQDWNVMTFNPSSAWFISSFLKPNVEGNAVGDVFHPPFEIDQEWKFSRDDAWLPKKYGVWRYANYVPSVS